MKIILALLVSVQLFGQSSINSPALQLDEIMKGNSFIGHQAQNIRWSATSEKIVFDWNPNNLIGNSEYSYTLSTKKIDSIIPDFYTENVISRSFIQHPIEIYSYQGDLYKLNRKTKKISLLYNSDESIRNVQQFENSHIVYFQKQSGFYSYSINTGTINLIASFEKGAKPNHEEEEMSQLEAEELKLFKFNQEEQAEKEWRKAKRFVQNEHGKVYLKKSSVSNIQISPDGNFITFRLNDYPETESTHVENHISKDGYTYTSNARSKVGNEDANHRLGILDLSDHRVYYVDFSTLSDIRKKPKFRATEYGDTALFYEKDRNIIMHSIQYNKDGSNNILDVRSYDNKDRWLVSVDIKNGEITEHQHQHDEAWIGGPGISSWNMVSGTLGWLNEQGTFYFQSEETGYSHLYSFTLKNKKKKQLTKGKWEVHEAQYSQKKNQFYITANKNHPGNRGFYHLSLKKNELTPILTDIGNFDITVSPNEEILAYRYSNINTPWELFYCENKANSERIRITNSTTKEFEAYDWHAPTVISFLAKDGIKVNARLYKPNTSNKNNAAIIFVHGAGYLQNAHNFWSGYHREYMFHNLLRDQGYTIIDIDYRASKGYGRDFRTAIYRHMGGADLSDHMDGRQYLIDSLGIDPEKIGIYGGSYGGFITLMALLTEPGKFACGAAIRSVTDWAHYNHEYTSNILNYPGNDPKAYKKSSPIYFAENLKDPLLILHGMVDDNVQFQDVVRLSQRFIELGIKTWEMAAYPVEPHGFIKTSSWVDEYSRIHNLFNEELLEKK